MGRLSSGDQAEVNRLVMLYIPMLAVVALGTMLLYAVMVIGQGGMTFIPEWAIAMGIALLGMVAALRNFSSGARLAITGVLLIGQPLLILLAFFALPNTEVFGYGTVLFGLNCITWSLMVPLVEQCSGLTEQSSTANKTIVLTLIPPFLKLVDARKLRKNMAFSGEALAAVIVTGTLAFAFGDFMSADDPSATIPTPLPYAVLFYGAIAALWSFTKLAQRIAETPGSIQVNGGFIRSWIMALLAIMGICGVLAALLPKAPIIDTGRAVNQLMFGDPSTRPKKKPKADENQTPGGQPGQNASASDARSRLPGQVSLPGMNKHGLVAAKRNPLVDGAVGAATSSLGLMEKVATAFEGKDAPKLGGKGLKSEQPGKMVHGFKISGPKPPKNAAPAKKQPDATPPTPAPDAPTPTQPASSTVKPGSQPSATPPPPNASPPTPASPPDVTQLTEQADRLQQLLTAKPIRLLKLLLALLLAIAALVGLVIVVKRYVWPLLSSVARWCWSRLRGKVVSHLDQYHSRQAEKQREREISHLLQTLPDPFANPFTTSTAPTGNAQACAAYDTFVAYLWLLNIERKPAETTFDFATRLCDTSHINARAVWCITRSSAQAQFSTAEVAEGDLVLIHESLREVTGYVLTRVPADDLPARQAAYRRLRAEAAYAAAREAAQQHLAAEAQLVANPA